MINNLIEQLKSHIIEQKRVKREVNSTSNSTKIMSAINQTFTTTSAISANNSTGFYIYYFYFKMFFILGDKGDLGPSCFECESILSRFWLPSAV